MMARIVTCEDTEGNSFSLMEEVRPDRICKTPAPVHGTGASVTRYGCFSPFRTLSRSS